MKLKIKLKRICLTATLSLVLSLGLFPSFAALTVRAQETTTHPMSDNKEWIYKVENGKLYKRLYNTRTGEWETDWIYVRNMP